MYTLGFLQLQIVKKTKVEITRPKKKAKQNSTEQKPSRFLHQSARPIVKCLSMKNVLAFQLRKLLEPKPFLNSNSIPVIAKVLKEESIKNAQSYLSRAPLLEK